MSNQVYCEYIQMLFGFLVDRFVFKYYILFVDVYKII